MNERLQRYEAEYFSKEKSHEQRSPPTTMLAANDVEPRQQQWQETFTYPASRYKRTPRRFDSLDALAGPRSTRTDATNCADAAQKKNKVVLTSEADTLCVSRDEGTIICGSLADSRSPFAACLPPLDEPPRAPIEGEDGNGASGLHTPVRSPLRRAVSAAASLAPQRPATLAPLGEHPCSSKALELTLELNAPPILDPMLRVNALEDDSSFDPMFLEAARGRFMPLRELPLRSPSRPAPASPPSPPSSLPSPGAVRSPVAADHELVRGSDVPMPIVMVTEPAAISRDPSEASGLKWVDAHRGLAPGRTDEPLPGADGVPAEAPPWNTSLPPPALADDGTAAETLGGGDGWLWGGGVLDLRDLTPAPPPPATGPAQRRRLRSRFRRSRRLSALPAARHGTG